MPSLNHGIGLQHSISVTSDFDMMSSLPNFSVHSHELACQSFLTNNSLFFKHVYPNDKILVYVPDILLLI